MPHACEALRAPGGDSGGPRGDQELRPRSALHRSGTEVDNIVARSSRRAVWLRFGAASLALAGLCRSVAADPLSAGPGQVTIAASAPGGPAAPRTTAGTGNSGTPTGPLKAGAAVGGRDAGTGASSASAVQIGASTGGASETEAAADSSSRQSDWEAIKVDLVQPGNSTRQMRRTAIDELPLQRLSPEARQMASRVVDNVSLHRRLPVVDCDADPRIVQYFLLHPDVAVAIWHVMDVTQMQLKPLGGNRYLSDAGDGTQGVITVLYSDAREQLIHCEGLFKSPVLPRPIQAAALMHFQAAYPQAGRGATCTQCKLDVFVAFPSTTVETAARVIAPVSHRIADRNFEEVAMFIRMMHLAMTRQPGWVEQVASRLAEVPAASRERLLDVTAQVYVDAQRRTAQQTVTPEGLRLPIRREPGVEASSGAAVQTAARE